MPFFHSMPVSFFLRRGLPVVGLILSLVLVSGCSTKELLNTVKPYKIDIIQGNFVSREMAEQLKPGLSKAEVSEILGSPLLISVFHSDRWDYVFTLQRMGVAPQSRRLTVFFKDNVLQRVEGDSLPKEADFVNSLFPRR